MKRYADIYLTGFKLHQQHQQVLSESMLTVSGSP